MFSNPVGIQIDDVQTVDLFTVIKLELLKVSVILCYVSQFCYYLFLKVIRHFKKNFYFSKNIIPIILNLL